MQWLIKKHKAAHITDLSTEDCPTNKPSATSFQVKIQQNWTFNPNASLELLAALWKEKNMINESKLHRLSIVLTVLCTLFMHRWYHTRTRVRFSKKVPWYFYRAVLQSLFKKISRLNLHLGFFLICYFSAVHIFIFPGFKNSTGVLLSLGWISGESGPFLAVYVKFTLTFTSPAAPAVFLHTEPLTTRVFFWIWISKLCVFCLKYSAAASVGR